MTTLTMPPPTLEVAVMHDARAIHDCPNILLRYDVKGLHVWVVAEITPGLNSGSATVPGAFIRSETGQLVAPKGGQTVTIKEGKWRLVAPKQEAQITESSYSWMEPVEKKRVLTPEDLYSPFVHGGTIVFRHEPNGEGIGQFQSAQLIFSDWATFVAPAFIYLRNHPRLLETEKVFEADVDELTHLLTEENKLLAVWAFQKLVVSGQITAETAHRNLWQAKMPLDATFSYLLLTNLTKDNVAQQVETVIQGSADIPKLRSLALAAFSSILFDSTDSRIVARGKSTIEKVSLRLRQLGITSGQDPYLSLILSKAGAS